MSAPSSVNRPTLHVVPVLPSLNFSQTREFYVGSLGFEEVGFACDDYMVVQREGVELRFWLSDDPVQCESSSLFFRAAAPADIYQELCARGIDAIMTTCDNEQPINFHVRDPHGNLLMFGGGAAAQH